MKSSRTSPLLLSSVPKLELLQLESIHKSIANLLFFAFVITAVRLSGITSFIVISRYTLTTKVSLYFIFVCITVISLVDSDSIYHAIKFLDK